MAKSKVLKANKRIKTDKFLLQVGIVALVGGFLVYGSYAYQARGSGTSKPGEYRLENIKRQGAFYQMSFAEGLKYCFGEFQERARVSVYGDFELQNSYVLDENGCFVAKENANDARTTITGVGRDSVLKVTKQ